jgi:hypothetical protein
MANIQASDNEVESIVTDSLTYAAAKIDRRLSDPKHDVTVDNLCRFVSEYFVLRCSPLTDTAEQVTEAAVTNAVTALVGLYDKGKTRWRISSSDSDSFDATLISDWLFYESK